MAPKQPLIIRQLGFQDYAEVFQLMQVFTDRRTDLTNDEIWIVEHFSVFTQGQAGKDEYIICPGDIPVISTDRGGHVTYHGPGQIICYFVIDLKKIGFTAVD